MTTVNKNYVKQKLAVGKPITQRYKGLGLAGPMISPPSKLFGFIVGMPASGKSSFMQSHPNALIINADLSSTTTSNPTAAMWPAMDPKSGMPVEPYKSSEVRTIELTWDKILQMKKDLIVLANQDDDDRPETIVLDSLGSALALVRKYVTKKAGKSDWKDMDGRRAWDDVYENLVSFASDLRAAGYGVYYVCHLVNAKIPIGDDRYTFRPELTITDGFYKRLFPLFELVAAFECEIGTETTMIETQGPNGKKGPKRPSTVQYKRHYLKVNDETLNGITKCRVNLPDKFLIPAEGGWEAFEAEYLNAQ